MKRIFSCILTSLLIAETVLAFAGCGAKVKRENVVIKETDTWYSCNVIDVAGKSSALDYEHFTFFTPMVIDDLIVATYNAYNDMYTDEPHDPILIFDSEGNLLKEFEITDELPLSSKLGVVKDGDAMALYYQSSGKLYKADINRSTWTLENSLEIDIGGETVHFMNCMSSGGYVFAIGVRNSKNILYVFNGGTVIFENEINVEYPVLEIIAGDICKIDACIL